jgi:predicted transcriptional regulator
LIEKKRTLFEILTAACFCYLIKKRNKHSHLINKEEDKKKVKHINKAPTAHLRKSERISNYIHSTIYIINKKKTRKTKETFDCAIKIEKKILNRSSID